MQEYIHTSHATIHGSKIHLPTGDLVPNDGTGRSIQAGIDTWLMAHLPAPTAAPAAQAVFVRNPPLQASLYFDLAPPSPVPSFQEVAESHILQISEVHNIEASDNSDDEPQDIFQVFASKKKKCSFRPLKLPKVEPPKTKAGQPKPTTPSVPMPTAQPPVVTPSTPPNPPRLAPQADTTKLSPQYHY
jgi:hypothetical protein